MDVIVGKKLPAFSLADETGELCTDTALLGVCTVLYFYPRDDTPGCTQEAADFTAAQAQFKRHNAVIYGVSGDSVKKHQAFIAKHQLQLKLLADETRAFCTACGVIKEKNMYGKKYMGIARTTFILDEHNIVRARFDNVKVKGHAEAVLAELKVLQAA